MNKYLILIGVPVALGVTLIGGLFGHASATACCISGPVGALVGFLVYAVKTKGGRGEGA